MTNKTLINNVLGQTLDAYPWTYFVTLTTRNEMTLKSARRFAKSFIHRVNVKEMERRQGLGKNAFVWFAESHKDKKGYHLHGLINCKLTVQDLTKTWQSLQPKNESGKRDSAYCRVLYYVKDFGASFYVAKYVTKKAADWDFELMGCNTIPELLQGNDFVDIFTETNKPITRRKRLKN